jgi:hypothetical protein
MMQHNKVAFASFFRHDHEMVAAWLVCNRESGFSVIVMVAPDPLAATETEQKDPRRKNLKICSRIMFFILIKWFEVDGGIYQGHQA